MSTPSRATYRAGGSVGNQCAYSSLSPAKSDESVNRTPTSTTSFKVASPRGWLAVRGAGGSGPRSWLPRGCWCAGRSDHARDDDVAACADALLVSGSRGVRAGDDLPGMGASRLLHAVIAEGSKPCGAAPVPCEHPGPGVVAGVGDSRSGRPDGLRREHGSVGQGAVSSGGHGGSSPVRPSMASRRMSACPGAGILFDEVQNTRRTSDGSVREGLGAGAPGHAWLARCGHGTRPRHRGSQSP